MEKLLRVIRLRVSDEMYLDIRHFMTLDDRKYVEDATRHLLRTGLEQKRRERGNVMAGDSGDAACLGLKKPLQRVAWNGQERRRA
jgi:hypothetical protein